jgi:hypothetical protein
MRRWLLSSAVVLVALLSACTPGAKEAQEFAGNWKSETWGSYLTITGGSAQVFEFTDVHCFEVGGGGVRGIDDVLELDGERLVLSDAGRSVIFDRIEFIPTECVAEVVGDPGSTFDVAVSTIERHHAAGTDSEWDQRVAELRPPADADDEAVFAAITGLLGPLAHPDVRVASPDRDIWRSVTAPSVELLEGRLEGFDGIVSAFPAEGVAYLGFLRMGGFGEDEENSAREISSIIDRAVASDTVILDLRAADGGSVTDAMIIASRFVTDERVVASFEATGPFGTENAGVTGVRPLQVGTFEGTVYVLIGPGTAGAAELLAQAMSQVPGSVLVGTNTAGAAAPRMVRQLPNGWVIGLANLAVASADGSDLSGGVVPLIESDTPIAEVSVLLGVDF